VSKFGGWDVTHFVYGAIRVNQAVVAHEHPVLTVVAGTPDPATGEISLEGAKQLVADGSARWIGEEP
jgi:hypothetical protein